MIIHYFEGFIGKKFLLTKFNRTGEKNTTTIDSVLGKYPFNSDPGIDGYFVAPSLFEYSMWDMQKYSHMVLKETASYMTDSVKIKLGFFNANAKIMMLYTSKFIYKFTGISYETHSFECFKPWFREEPLVDFWTHLMTIVFIIDIFGVSWVAFDTIYQIVKASQGPDTVRPWERMNSRRSCIFWCCLRGKIERHYNRQKMPDTIETQQDVAHVEGYMLTLPSEPPLSSRFRNPPPKNQDMSMVIEKRSVIPENDTPEFK
jgi:hypothetical protein